MTNFFNLFLSDQIFLLVLAIVSFVYYIVKSWKLIDPGLQFGISDNGMMAMLLTLIVVILDIPILIFAKFILGNQLAYVYILSFIIFVPYCFIAMRVVRSKERKMAA